MKAPLHTEQLAIGYGSRSLLSGLDLELRRGELIALIGINGIGKSTLLRTLAGLQQPRAGRVLLEDLDLYSLPAADRAQLVSIVLTGRPPTGQLDVETLVSLGRQPWTGRWGKLTDDDRSRISQALDRTGAAHLRAKSLGSCSDGECQKVLIARALAQATPVMLLDEPTAYLDLPNRSAIVHMLRSIAGEEMKAVLFSTHDLQLALDLCDRIILLRREDAVWQGSPAEALLSGELERAFSGSGIQFDPANGTHRFLR